MMLAMVMMRLRMGMRMGMVFAIRLHLLSASAGASHAYRREPFDQYVRVSDTAILEGHLALSLFNYGVVRYRAVRLGDGRSNHPCGR